MPQSHCMICEHSMAAHEVAGRCGLCLQYEEYKHHIYRPTPPTIKASKGPRPRVIMWLIFWTLIALGAMALFALVFG